MTVLLRWIGFVVGLGITAGTVVGVMKTFIVPRRSWSLIPASVGRYGFRIFHSIAVRLNSFDLADRFLGFLAPTVIIGMLASFLASFVLGFALLLLPWGEPTIGDALRESGSSVFTLGFVSSGGSVPTAIDIVAGATGMIFVALTIGYLPTLYGEVTKREVLVKQLEGWTGSPSWGPQVLARLASVEALNELPALYRSWDRWSARVADSHLKYPVLTQFRLPRAGNHWAVALLAMMDAAALDLSLRPDAPHSSARLFLNQGTACLSAVTYPMRRISDEGGKVGIDRSEFDHAVDLLRRSGFPEQLASSAAAWDRFSAIRATYAPLAYQLAYWTIAAPAPWSGGRAGFEYAQTDQPYKGGDA